MAMTWMRMPMANDDNDDADCDDTGGVGECDDAVGEATDLEKTAKTTYLLTDQKNLPLQIAERGVPHTTGECFRKCLLGLFHHNVQHLAVVVYIFLRCLGPVFPTVSSGRQGGCC